MEELEAVFFDIDGTLLGLQSKSIPQSTIEALQILKKQGVKLFVSTGRTYTHAKFLQTYGFDGFITFNGGYCVDESETPFFKQGIAVEDLHRLHTHLQEVEHFPVGVMTAQGSFISDLSVDVLSIFELLKLQVPCTRPFVDALDLDVLQLNLFVDEKKEQHLIQNVLSACVSSRWCPQFIDVNARGINKQVGMEQFFERYDIDPAKTMAFGDGGNDIEMLQSAGIGVAMRNASDRVKAVADYVTGTTEENGIWNALKAYQVI
jgi:Cof subfamily protein (haloacid dehalogenase superfamily)